MKSGRIFFGLIFLLMAACPALAQEVGKIMSIVGTAEVLRKERWQSVSLDETLQAGDIVRTGPGSRVAVLLADGSQIKVNANSQLALKQAAVPTRQVAMRLMQSLLRLFSGEIWVRSLGEPLEIETLAATATIRGTELNLAVESTDTAHLAVVEGLVEFHNPQGSVLVGVQEQALAKVGEAPRKTVLLNPLDAVQWSLYYPGIVSYRDYSLAEVGPALLQKRLTELERRAATAPQDVNAVIALGEVLFDLGKRMEARNQFEKALRLAPRDPRAHTGLGWVYLEAGESEAALRQFRQAEPLTLMGLMGKAHALYRLNRFERALEVIAEAKRHFPRSPQPWTQAALIYLVQGRVPGALAELDRALRLDPKYALAHGLHSNIYLVRNQKERALEAAQRAVAANPLSPTAHLDLSLVKQAEFKLEEALQAARKAVALDPENPQALTQVSRLLFGQGEIDEASEFAERARRLAPQDPVVLSTWGFIQLTHERVNEAIATFDRAIVQDSTRGEPHLGKGLALFRRGRTEDGVKEMRIATLLEPKVSLYHSYLGKAFYEVKEDKLARQQLALAKEMDPRDPTPYFYDAIRKQSVNRPVEALEDLQKSIELNDNRAVYRSRFLLDADLAARGAALGRVYQELGFEQSTLVEGWKSLNTDPTDYSAHRLLADSYSALPRHDVARVSELLQSQLLQPINITPVQPQLAESDLFLLGGLGPAEPSLNEFNSLFLKNRFSLLASGLVASNETYGDEVVHSGLWRNLSYSLGQFHYETDGFRTNSDLNTDIYNVFAQLSFLPRSNVQLELRSQDTESGDLRQLADPAFIFENLRESFDRDTVRLGFGLALAPNATLLGSLGYRDLSRATTILTLNRFSDHISANPILAPLSSLIVPLLPIGFNNTQLAKNEVQNGSIEFQYIQRWNRFNLIFGGGYTHQEKTRTSSITPSLTSPLSANLPQQLEQQLLDPELSNIVIDFINGTIRDQIVEPFEERFDESDSNAYAYISTEIFDDLSFTLGAAFHSLDQDNTQGSTLDFSHQYILPKIGAVWRPSVSTTVRAAWLKNLKRPFASGQTIEPTHIAGFNQLYDDADAARSERYGFALDQVFLMGIKAGLEISWRDVNIPIFITGLDAGVRWVRQNEKAHRIYIYWTPMDRLAFASQYFFESFDREPRIEIFGGEPIKLTTHRAPLSLSYYSRSGLFSNFTASYINQDVVVRGFADDDFPQSDRFWILDASVGYRLPKRWGIINLGVRNLLDEKFSFQDANFNPFAVIEGELLPPPFVPERVLYAQITLAF